MSKKCRKKSPHTDFGVFLTLFRVIWDFFDTFLTLEYTTKYQERKISPKRKFSGRISRGHPGVIRADVPAQNFGQGPRNSGKTSIWARTSTTRSVRTSTTPRDLSEKLRSEKLWAEFSFPTLGAGTAVWEVAYIGPCNSLGRKAPRAKLWRKISPTWAKKAAKIWRNFRQFSSFNFQEKWTQEISRAMKQNSFTARLW